MVTSDLFQLHPNTTAWIIGKGPSLARLRRSDIGRGPVIAISDSIITVEKLRFFRLPNPIYSLQQDGCSSRKTNWALGERPTALPPHPVCDPAVPRPKKATLIVSAFLSPNCLADYTPRIVLDAGDLGQVECLPSAHLACYLAQYMGCSRLVFLCFDAHESGDTRTFEAHLGRVVDRGAAIASNAEMYLGIARDLDLLLPKIGLPFEFVTPT